MLKNPSFVTHLGVSFEVISSEEKHGRTVRKVECSLCQRLLLEKSIPSHVEAHDKRANAAANAKRRAMLGTTTKKPLAGQLGFEAFGVGEVKGDA